jgi:hypothetical protein
MPIVEDQKCWCGRPHGHTGRHVGKPTERKRREGASIDASGAGVRGAIAYLEAERAKLDEAIEKLREIL